MKAANLKLSWRSRRPYEIDVSDVTIEFDNVSNLRNFINSGDKIFKVWSSSSFPEPFHGYITFRIIKISKIKNRSIDALVERITLRDYNLDLILVGI